MGTVGQPKQYIPLLGDPILAWTLRACAAADAVAAIVLVVASEDVSYCQRQANDVWRVAKPVHVVAGGASRQHSVLAGIQALPSDIKLVAVHDGVRPLMQPRLLQVVLAAAQRYGAATAAVGLKDTVKQVQDEWVVATPVRSSLRAVQTPQAFQRSLLVAAHARAAAEQWQATDDAALVERAGQRVRVVDGSYANIKITTPEDLLVAETLLRAAGIARSDGETGAAIDADIIAPDEVGGTQPGVGKADGDAGTKSESVGSGASLSHMSNLLRVGIGYDVHALAADRPLILGGVHIPAPSGLAGHSDADVLLHAIMDALLGAAGLGDIGRLFPDTDARFKDVSSVTLLQRVAQLLTERGWQVGNVDATIAAERPKLAPHVPDMVRCISETLAIPIGAVNVKATTSEGLGFVGTGEGMAAHAVATLYRGAAST